MNRKMSIEAGNVIIHEGYLLKTPPLDNFFVNWKKRWFVLSRGSPQDPTSLDLSYYTEASKKDKVKSIDVREIKTINPVHNESKENVFSLEMSNRKKFMLRSADKQGKAIWVAKLLECCSKEGTSFHVTVPDQPGASFSECILKVNTPLKINAVSSFDGEQIMSIPYHQLRRFGCQVAVESDIVWFETCSCDGTMEEFHFFIVALGIEKAYQIVQEYKRSIELALRVHIIMEEGDQSQCLYSYVVKSHYGHQEFPTIGRERILQSSLLSLSSSGGSLSLSELNKFARSRPTLTVGGIPHLAGPIPGDMGGYASSASPNMLSSMRSSSIASPPTSPSAGYPNGRGGTNTMLDQLKLSPRLSGRKTSQTSAPADFDSGVNMEGLDPARHSAPCYLPALDKPAASSRGGGATAKGFDNARLSKSTGGGKVMLSEFRAAKSMDYSRGGERTSLADLQVKGAYSRSPQAKRNGYDSAVGSASDLLAPARATSSGGVPMSSTYDHLGTSSGRGGGQGYDRLSESMSGMSLRSAYANSKGRGPAYVDS